MLQSLSCVACVGDVHAAFTVAGHQYVRCRRCGTLQLAMPPQRQELRRLYQRDDTWTSSKDRSLDDPRQEERETRRRLTALRDLGVDLGRVFELGPGQGYLARALAASGSDVTVFELHEETSNQLRADGINALRDLSSLHGQYDTIMLWGVVEHLEDPFEMLSALQKRLAPSGSFVILTEDSACWLARMAGRRWTWLLPPEHVVLFSRRGLEACFGRLGCKLVAYRAWPTDIRAILCSALGHERAAKWRERFRTTRRLMATSQVSARSRIIGAAKRIIDARLGVISEHKVYRFSMQSPLPANITPPP